ncbi:sensor histidine kinase [Agromyces soli]
MLLRYAATALLFLAGVGLIGGWFLAGRMLRPLDRIAAAARLAAAGSLSHRIELDGPDDEFRDLADTFDEMLARIERSFDEQRRFAANASHELRTPHAVMRTMLEVARADPDRRATPELLRRLEVTNERAIATVESLLALSRIGGREPRREPVAFAELAAAELETIEPAAHERRLEVAARLDPVEVHGDPELLAALVANLLRNAVQHNVDGGTIAVELEAVRGAPQAARAVRLVVDSSGPAIDPERVESLVEPFVRGTARVRGGSRAAGDAIDGSGLGLAIVAAVVRAHAGTLLLAAREGGGLHVEVVLPA